MKKSKGLFLAFVMMIAVFAAVPAHAEAGRSGACGAYRSYLNTIIETKKISYFWAGEKVTQRVVPATYKFGLKDLNSDGVPELFITGLFRGYRTVVLTYYKGSIYQLDIDQGTTYYKFSGNKKLLMAERETRSYTSWTYCTISRGSFVTVASRVYNPSTDAYTYYDRNGRTISKTQFQLSILKYGVTVSTAKDSSRRSSILLKANVQKYCK